MNDTAATETYYIKGYHNLEETIKVQISGQRRENRQMPMFIINYRRGL